MKLLHSTKTVIIVVFTIFLLLLCSSCQPEPAAKVLSSAEPTAAPTKAPKEHPADYVRFYRSTEPQELYVPVEEIMAYESQYPDCNGTWYRNQLSGEDLCIYNSYLYSMEHCFVSFDVYVEDNTKDFSYIRDYLSMDSPFLEQNQNRYGEYIYKNALSHHGKSMDFTIEQFTSSRWEMKMEVLAKCRQIVADIPAEYSTRIEKMKYLYEYVCDNVTYVSYESMADESYLYDAVCKGETVCDGYSNMLSLLFNLIGVECCETIGNDGTVGHTWVVAELDGKMYNFDATFDDSDDSLLKEYNMYFGVSDEMLTMTTIDYEEIRPKCTDTSRDYAFADLVVENISDSSEIQKIAELADSRMRNGQQETLVVSRKQPSTEERDVFLDKFFYGTSEISAVDATYITTEGFYVISLSTEAW